ncbi:MAG: helix-turn-helix transcriptional regulator, partial [Muribaculaceae bacterium]|nr:helix-turn-helix transcriptional regulator [Muribaculaceae bacterium]
LRDKYSSPSYWTQLKQLMLHDNVRQYLEENGMTQSKFAEKLGVTKGYISQIMNGDFNHRLSKLVELALACDMVPKMELVPKKYAEQVALDSYIQPQDWKMDSVFSSDFSVDSVLKRPIGIQSYRQISLTGSSRTEMAAVGRAMNWEIIKPEKVA